MDRTEPRNAWVESNVPPGDSLPLFPQGEKTRYTDEVWGGDGESRLVSSVTLEDQYSILENMELTAGTRCDYFDDLAQAYFSPRIGMVYFLDRHIFKVQYAQTFRPPKFMELYAKKIPFRSGNPDLKPENIETWEACYIYKGADFLGRLTVFHTNVEDRIVDMGAYQNEPGTVKIDGADFEFEYRPNRTVSVEGNLSYLDTEHYYHKDDLEEIPDWLGNVGFTCPPDFYRDMELNVQGRFMSKREIKHPISREPIDGFFVVNMTLSHYDLIFPGLTLRAGIRNLFDEDIRYSSRVTTNIFTGEPFVAYPDDYPGPGRTWTVQASYEF